MGRAGDVDLLRAFGIVLMVMGHVGFGSLFDKWIHAFHMPLWFIISGYFLNTDRSVLEHLKKKVRTLLVPYVAFGVAYELLWARRGEGARWLGLLYPNTIQVPLNGALWFLPALFAVDIFGFVIIKFFPKYMAYLLLGAAALLGCQHWLALPLALDSALVGAGLFLAGYLIRKCPGILKLEMDVSLLLLMFTGGLIFINGYVNVRGNQYANIPLFWMNAVLTLVAFWNICRWIDGHIDLKFIKEIGADSLIYVCCNQYLLYVLDMKAAAAGGGHPE